MRKTIIISIFMILTISVTSFAAGQTKTIEVLIDSINLLVNGTKIKAPNILYNGTTYLPVRNISEILELKVGWDGATSTVSLNEKNKLDKPTQQSDYDKMDWNNLESYYHPLTFKGWFKNTDYSNPEAFLQNGPQTESQTAKEIAKQFNDKKDITTLSEIYTWMLKNLYSYSMDDINKYSRTTEEILQSKKLTGCTDYGLVFASLAREAGIPTVYVQTAKIPWIEKVLEQSSLRYSVEGHIFVEVYINGKWMLVDSTAGVLYRDYDKANFNFPLEYYVFAKGIEPWESGIRHESHNMSVMLYLFRNFDLSLYKNPELRGETLLTEKININSESYKLYLVTNSKYLAENVDIAVPKEIFRKQSFIKKAGSQSTFLEQKETFNSIVVTHIKGQPISSSFADYIRKQFNLDSNKLNGMISGNEVKRVLFENEDGIFLFIVGSNEESIAKDIVMNTVDEVFLIK